MKLIVAQVVVGVLAALSLVASTTSEYSMGTLVDCGDEPGSCKWAAGDGRLVSGRELQEIMVRAHTVGVGEQKLARRNLERHMNYIEDVHSYAQSLGHGFLHRMGVNYRHLTDTEPRAMLPQTFVHREIRAGGTRARQLTQLASSANASSSSVASTLNWCTTNNPKGRSVCSTVKSQEKCGSCWAFAATDAIETAVAIAANQTQATALSPQQFLSCSNRTTEQTFTYCWAKSGVSGSSWVSRTIKWRSTNNGCNGGMTHGAFLDAAEYEMGLLPGIEMPYDDSNGNSTTECIRTSNKSVASITGWEQVVGKDCLVSSDANTLLKTALQKQPIAVAINSAGSFKDYKGGFYSCPNSGNLASKDDVNHALVLVGYGTDSASGDYWILKNSYGGSWGNSGFLYLIADSKLNCGLNIFPVVPTGASASAAKVNVDGGGERKFVGLTPSGWIVLAIVTSIITIVATAIGVVFSRKRRDAVRAQATGAASYERYTQTYT